MRRIPNLAIASAIFVMGGCSSSPSLFEALSAKYPGYREVSPKLSPPRGGMSLTEGFPYTPGTLISASAAPDLPEAVLAQSDLYCGPGIPLQRLGYWKRQSYRYSLADSEREVSPQQWLSQKLGGNGSEYDGINEVIIELTNVRSYLPTNKQWEAIKKKTSSRCAEFIALGFSNRQVRGIVVGDVKIRISVNLRIGAIASQTLGERIMLSFGLRAVRHNSYEFEGKNLVFGVRL